MNIEFRGGVVNLVVFLFLLLLFFWLFPFPKNNAASDVISVLGVILLFLVSFMRLVRLPKKGTDKKEDANPPQEPRD